MRNKAFTIFYIALVHLILILDGAHYAWFLGLWVGLIIGLILDKKCGDLINADNV